VIIWSRFVCRLDEQLERVGVPGQTVKGDRSLSLCLPLKQMARV
jgi:hypothetical protein